MPRRPLPLVTCVSDGVQVGSVYTTIYEHYLRLHSKTNSVWGSFKRRAICKYGGGSIMNIAVYLRPKPYVQRCRPSCKSRFDGNPEVKLRRYLNLTSPPSPRDRGSTCSSIPPCQRSVGLHFELCFICFAPSLRINKNYSKSKIWP